MKKFNNTGSGPRMDLDYLRDLGLFEPRVSLRPVLAMSEGKKTTRNPSGCFQQIQEEGHNAQCRNILEIGHKLAQKTGKGQGNLQLGIACL